MKYDTQKKKILSKVNLHYFKTAQKKLPGAK